MTPISFSEQEKSFILKLLNRLSEKTPPRVLSAFIVDNQQAQNFGRELVFSADLCYNWSNEKPPSEETLIKSWTKPQKYGII